MSDAGVMSPNNDILTTDIAYNNSQSSIFFDNKPNGKFDDDIA